MDENKVCLKCKKSLHKGLHINWSNYRYCSKRCREKYWQETHRGRISFYQKKHRLKTAVLCRWCSKAIPNNARKSGVTYCSGLCRQSSKKNIRRKQEKKVSLWFYRLKESIGCNLCGYSVFGGSLDFHHLDPKEKDRRITRKHAVSQSILITAELQKCILLCKNCHAEVHHRYKLI